MEERDQSPADRQTDGRTERLTGQLCGPTDTFFWGNILIVALYRNVFYDTADDLNMIMEPNEVIV